jgi:hypothetical protein
MNIQILGHRKFEAIAKINSIRSVIVLQPSSIFEKYWAQEETAVVAEKGYEDSYAPMTKLLAANLANFLVLSAMFADEGTIFGDSIHFASNGLVRRSVTSGWRKRSRAI